MKNRIQKKYLFLVTAYLLPALVFAQSTPSKNLVPCGGAKQPQCGFVHIGELIQNIIGFLIVWVYPIAFTISLVWAGILLLTANGSETNVSKARAIVKSMVYGLIIMLTAWLVVYTILTTLGVTNTPLVK